MLIDLNEIDPQHFGQRRYDVVICGAGVAGIILGLKLSPYCNVALLEAGGLDYSTESQELYSGVSVGQEYFDLRATRLRYLGGSSNHWGGWCRPLDVYDFQGREQVPFSGWPISKTDLDPYLSESCRILGLDADAFLQDEQIKPEDGFKEIRFQWSKVQFGKKYLQALTKSPTLFCYLNANVTDVMARSDAASVTHLEVSSYSGTTHQVFGRVFVLAAGGLENPRILLNSTGVQAEGLGNRNGNVGRFFAEHPHDYVGHFILDLEGNGARFEVGNQNGYSGFFSPSKTLMDGEAILNFGLRIQPFAERTNRPFMHKLKALLCSVDWMRTAVDDLRGHPMDCWEYRDFDGSIKIASEQAPNRDSRVMLDGSRDRFGNRRLKLDWRLTDIDKRTLKMGAMAFARVFASHNYGRIRIADWLLADDIEFPGIAREETAGNHHMCTTRMSDSPATGVVDADQKVFGVENLYVAGSSVFATTGHANPTFTITQMTLRLADHLRARLA